MTKFEILVGIEVQNESLYADYRAAMKPILHEMGGDFVYDFQVQKVLKKEVEHGINRLFTIQFPNKEIMQAFFQDERYLAIKAQYFTPSVKEATIIRSYDVVT
ncbi:DUF1330 domain-containing protein [Pseudoalteromonas luteoviolacea]|uniref:DUF1330 domain-containing protein n=1 Tax=Pseudoalteromonas luteoviolacea TaxID=43657 RepID=UPI001151940B|nr:DUF1330 domain-containing protein [Pseudoalteromonas luteoviolacea]TQF70846.1 DUF1330 domain-containing protein [Pseudoalteromonas luteoviolacea]